MPEQLKKILDRIVEWWKKFNNKQRILLVSIVGTIVLSLVILAFVITKPIKVELIACENAADASEIKDILTNEGIDYEVESDLIFYVNEEDEVDATMLLAKNNFPAKSYDISNVTDGSFSTTEADKQKKYKVYLEKKFEEHLSQLAFVENAYVDITLPENDGTILSKEEEGTAAITLELKDSINEEQAYAIARFVATELGNETTDGVTIIDNKANVLYSGADAQSSAYVTNSQLSYKDKQKKMIESEIVAALENSGVFSNIEVAMNLNMNFDSVETASEEYEHPQGGDESFMDSKSVYESSTTNGDGAVPGTDSNNDDVTYVTQDNNNSTSEITDTDIIYNDNKTVTKTISNGGKIDYDGSSVSVVATRYVVYDQDTMESGGKLEETTWEEFKSNNSDPVKIEEVDEELVSMISTATGFSKDNITFLIYEQPEFIDKDISARSWSDILQILLAVFIFALLGFVVFRSTRTQKQVEPEPELSVEALLDSTAEALEEPLGDVGYAEKSETRILIERFVDENPDAAALLLRNWLNEDWE